jgi:hypothetical protein
VYPDRMKSATYRRLTVELQFILAFVFYFISAEFNFSYSIFKEYFTEPEWNEKMIFFQTPINQTINGEGTQYMSSFWKVDFSLSFSLLEPWPTLASFLPLKFEKNVQFFFPERIRQIILKMATKAALLK